MKVVEEWAAIQRFCMAVVLNVDRATYVKQIAARPMAGRRMAHHLSGCTSKNTECGRARADGENSKGDGRGRGNNRDKLQVLFCLGLLE